VLWRNRSIAQRTQMVRVIYLLALGYLWYEAASDHAVSHTLYAAVITALCAAMEVAGLIKRRRHRSAPAD
jgi:hypothetical protein